MPPDPFGDPALAALTRALARGDDAAWQEFHRTHGRTLFHHLLAATRGDPHLASEALQHAYLRVARHVRPCDQPAQWRVWLRVVARSALADLHRGRRRFWQLLRRRAADPHDAPGVASAASPDERSRDDALHERLAAALARLPPDGRGLLERKYLHGDSVEALALALGLSPKAVESRLTRARAALREAFLAVPDANAASELTLPRTQER